MNPRPLGAVGSLEGPDFVVAPQCLQYLIKPLKKAGATARIDFKAVALSRR